MLTCSTAGRGKNFDMAVALEAVQRMEQAGFQVEAVNGALRVKPAERPTTDQRDWLRSHKAELLVALAIRSDPNIAAMVALFSAAVVKVGPLDSLSYTPPVDDRRRCADCRHRRPVEGDEPGAIQRCVVSENGIGYFAFQRHRCEWWDA